MDGLAHIEFETSNKHRIKNMLDSVRCPINVGGRDVGVLEKVVLPEPMIPDQGPGFQFSSLAQTPDAGLDLDDLSGPSPGPQHSREIPGGPPSKPTERSEAQMRRRRQFPMFEH
jgi:hypothetical protein